LIVFDFNGVVNIAVYNLWKANLGMHAGSGASATAAVPEPPTLLLLITAAAGWCLRRGWAALRVSILINA
jgi:hypothetical protein